MSKNRDLVMNQYVCDRYYVVSYRYYLDMVCYQADIYGLLLNYDNGNIVLLSKDGIYHIKFSNIYFMQPVKMPALTEFPEDFQKLLNELQNEDNRIGWLNAQTNKYWWH